jgi:uncharacterized delta-60 repeat protein
MAVVIGVCASALIFQAKLNAATGLDNSFNTVLDGAVASIALQADGKIVVGGAFTTVNGTARNYFARLNADGLLDETFAPASRPAQFVSRVLVVNSNIYISAGDGLRRFDTSGNLQWHYPMNAATFTVDPQQRVIFGGQFTRVEGQYHRNIARLTTSGAIDSTFATAIGCCAGESVDALAVQGNAVLVGGLFQSVNATSVVSHMARINADGSVDNSFSASATPRVLAFALTPDGKFFRASEQALVRHLANGADDPAFTPASAGGSSEDRFTTVTVGADGKPLVGGNFTFDGGASRSYVARFNSDGSRDNSFSVSPDAPVQTIAVQPDGRVLIGGAFTTVDGVSRIGLARVQSQTAAPALAISASVHAVVVSWPQSGQTFALESKALSDNTWAPVPVAPVVANGRNFVTNSPAGAGQLFRLCLKP